MNFKKEKFYTVELDLRTFRASSGKFNSKTDAEKLRRAEAEFACIEAALRRLEEEEA